VAVGCQLGLGDACVKQDRLPDDQGRLPNEYDNPCDTAEESEVEEASVQLSTQTSGTRIASVREEDLDSRLPYTEDFSSRTSQDFRAAHGKLDIVADNELPIYGSFSLQSTTAGRCLAVWKRGIPQTDWSTYFKKATLHFSMRRGQMGVLHNGGLMFNYHELNQVGWCVELDHEGTFTGRKGLRVAQYRGATGITYAFIPIRNLAPDTQYKLELTILPDENTPDAAWIFGRLSNNVDSGSKLYVNELIKPLMLTGFGEPTGLFGLHAYRSKTQFNRLIVDNAEVTQ
jgi:hypothetical protein